MCREEKSCDTWFYYQRNMIERLKRLVIFRSDIVNIKQNNLILLDLTEKGQTLSKDTCSFNTHELHMYFNCIICLLHIFAIKHLLGNEICNTRKY